MTTHDQHQPAGYPAAPTTVLPTYDPTPTVPSGTALPLEQAAAVALAGDDLPPAEPAKPTASEAIASFTGYDELAVERTFGKDIVALGETTLAMRAVAMILIKRDQQLDDTRAYRAAMSMRFAEVMDLFTPEDDEGDPAAALSAVMGGKAPSA